MTAWGERDRTVSVVANLAAERGQVRRMPSARITKSSALGTLGQDAARARSAFISDRGRKGFLPGRCPMFDNERSVLVHLA